MAQTASNVRVAVTGGVYRAPVGTALPTNSTDALPAEWKDVGYLTEDGIESDWFNESSNDIRAFQNGELVRRVKTETTSTATFTMLETSDEVRKFFYGDANVSPGHIKVTTEEGVRGPIVIDIHDGTHRERIVINDAQVTQRGATSRVNGDAITYQVTLTCYPVNGSPADIYSTDTTTSS